ncbi:DMT family transporter [Granulosicoccus antarcticus]|uniref:Riboflavin transporter n=1 Tax=Granulosicoccus antarcticus IMCC3135 TaxID=1192854 RepID=A0A2Z2NY57_9GAMM|nr:DMT family transporter [Granulosicoccus antarcticus]ASJ75415.1 Riboflavin transporter [Granulosicoccus antarcticus IMCC3135]
MEHFDKQSDNVKGALILMLAAFGFSLMVAMIKLVGERLPVTQILFVRQLGMTVMLAPVLVRTFPDSLRTSRLPLQIARILLAMIAMLCGFTAILNMPLADATAIAFAKSFFVTIFAVWFLKETIGLYRWSAVAIGFIGVLVMLRPGADGFTIYGLMAVTGAASAGLVMVIIRMLSRTEAPSTILAFQAIGVGLVMAIPAYIYWVPPTLHEWVLLAGIGVVSYFSQKANIYAYSYGEASLLASLDYVRLVYATLFGWWLFSELPGISTWVGAAIIIGASIYTVHRESRRKQRLSSGADGREFSNN